MDRREPTLDELTTLQERAEKATGRQRAAMKSIELSGVPTGADLFGIIARQRLLKRLIIEGGLLKDDGLAVTHRDLETVWRVLEAEAKAEVLEDIVAGMRGQANEHVTMTVPTATKLPEKH